MKNCLGFIAYKIREAKEDITFALGLIGIIALLFGPPTAVGVYIVSLPTAPYMLFWPFFMFGWVISCTLIIIYGHNVIDKIRDVITEYKEWKSDSYDKKGESK